MTTLARWLAAVILWLVYGLMVGLILAWGDPQHLKTTTALFAILGAVSYAALITLLFFGRRTL